jgi:hypothetical protein
MHQEGNKGIRKQGSRQQTAAMSDEGDNWQQHLRMKQETGARSWKQEDIWQDLRENHQAGDCEVNSRIFHQDSKNEHQDIVEGSAPFEMKEETTNNRLRTMYLEALPSLISRGGGAGAAA